MQSPIPHSNEYHHRTNQVSSRLVRNEQRKLTQQTIMYLALAIGLGLLFLFVIVPGVIRGLTGLLGSGGIAEESDVIPPQVPHVSAPVSATNSATLKLSGFGEAKSKVLLVHDGSQSADTTVADDGKFELEVTLHGGENTLSVYSVDAADNESAATQNFAVVFDEEAPQIEITEPQPDQHFETRKQQQLTVKGTTEPGSRVMINGRLAFAGADGSFSGSFQLQEGDNEVKIVATDQAGNATEKTFKVSFQQ